MRIRIFIIALVFTFHPLAANAQGNNGSCNATANECPSFGDTYGKFSGAFGFDGSDDYFSGRKHLLGDEFSVSDAYFFVVSSWAEPTGIGLDKWPNVAAFAARVAGREKVQEAMRAEGLLN